jgi:hypothetical protein
MARKRPLAAPQVFADKYLPLAHNLFMSNRHTIGLSTVVKSSPPAVPRSLVSIPCLPPPPLSISANFMAAHRQ